ncbi:ubiquinol-cytochrome c reductase iron-sulfur subunit [Microvirga sp. 2MCAF38]|uniref:ubiquinol-cytochrome c reductase iron-sulfur subunit n=1 Tax=Microvirga sp. 2MCAF38 TaxID=3232989 RepID=UPI003F96EFEE
MAALCIDEAIGRCFGGGRTHITISAGQQISFFWQGKPIFVLHRTEQASLKSESVISRLSDPESSVHQQPSYARNWSRSSKPEFLVLVAICTHLGCIPYVKPDPGDPNVDAAWPGGYFCPCHGSKYDLAGRVSRGVPAPYNLAVPPHHYTNDKTLVVGENPAGETFSSLPSSSFEKKRFLKGHHRFQITDALEYEIIHGTNANRCASLVRFQAGRAVTGW